MSENKISLFNAELPKSVDNAVQNLSDRPTKAIGDTLSGLWFLVFGNIDHSADKKRARHAVALEQYEKELRDRISEVPKEYKQEPNTHIAGLALDDSKYCVEEESLRAMFVELLAKATDSRYSNIIHPSFSGMISRMSPQDASNLSIFPKNGNFLPLANFNQRNTNSSIVPLQKNIFISNPIFLDAVQQAASIDRLSTLGLITIDFDHSLTNKTEYESFNKTSLYQALTTTATGGHIEIEQGVTHLNSFGKLFVKVCLN